MRLDDLRHTWATRAVETGIELVTLATMLEYSKINMVMRYAPQTQEHQSKSMDKMGEFVVAQKIALEHNALMSSQRIQWMKAKPASRYSP